MRRWVWVVWAGCGTTTTDDPTDGLTIDDFPQVTGTTPEPTVGDHQSLQLTLPVTYCVDASLTDVISAEEVRAAFDLWDDLTAAQVFRKDCDALQPDVTVAYDPAAQWTMRIWPSSAEIVLGQVPMVPQSAVDAGDCADQLGYEYVLAHHLGHVLGIGHSCEADGPVDCTDEELEALMVGFTEYCPPLAVNDWDRTALFTVHGLAE